MPRAVPDTKCVSNKKFVSERIDSEGNNEKNLFSIKDQDSLTLMIKEGNCNYGILPNSPQGIEKW